MWGDKNIEDALAVPSEGSLLIITVGNEMRADDGAGCYIARHLDIQLEKVKVFDVAMNPENSMDLYEQYHPQKVVFIDAANWEGKTGEVRLIPEELIPEQTLSTHMFPLSAIGALIKKDEDCEVYYLGIQLLSANLGENMCVEVRESCDKLIRYLQESYLLLQ